MIRHYFKIAFRNLLKYKAQSIISIIGLAMGFTCFALTVLWIRYEMTYDTFHEGADRIHLIYKKSILDATGFDKTVPYPVSTSLKRMLPEIEDACAFEFYKSDITVNDGATQQLYRINADSCFMNMFRIRVLEGNLDFLESANKIALTDKAANRLFGTENPIGKEIKVYGDPKTVCAIVNSWSEHTNLPFSILGGGIRQWQDVWYNNGFYVFIKLHQGVDAKALSNKLKQTEIKTNKNEGAIKELLMMPVSKCHYTILADNNAIQFNYIILFAVIGGLVILCSLINYLSLFISRLWMRAKELALRKVCGSSNRNLFALLTIEFLVILISAGLIGMALIELVLSEFKELSGVTDGNIYWESSLYFMIIIGCSLCLFMPVTLYFNRQTLHTNIQKSNTNRHRYFIRKASILFQLSISIGFIFCIRKTIYLPQQIK